MKKRLICLFMCILMIIPVCLMAGCAENTEQGALGDMEVKASEAALTLTMYLLTDQDVCSLEELAAIKEQHGEISPEYIEAKGIYDAHKKVEAEMNKITKAKYKTKLVVYWLTEDEYYTTIEEKIVASAEEKAILTAANKAYKAFEKAYKKAHADWELNGGAKLIWNEFCATYPEYADIIPEPVDKDEETSVTEEETVVGESGIIEIKYPEETKNQVDIMYLGGYDLYNKYIKNEWLTDLTSELSGASKALNSYLNAAFFDAMKVGGKSYAISTNKTIGEYTYLLVDRELYTNYYYPVDEIDKISSVVDIYDFIKDIAESGLDVVPFTGELIPTNTHFWSAVYEYKLIEDENMKGFAEGKYYYTKNENGTYSLVGKCYDNVEYFVQNSSSKHYELQTGLTELASSSAYFILSPDAYVKAETFVEGVTYYTVDEYNNYAVAADITEFADGTDYYKIDSSCFVKVDKEKYDATAPVCYYVKSGDEFKRAGTLTEFASGTTYYVVRDADEVVENAKSVGAKSMYVRYGAFDAETDYYTAEITFTPDEFSLMGSGYLKDADETSHLKFENVFTGTLNYTEQLLALKKIEENGYYDASAITDENKTFATAIVKGGAEIFAQYSDKYEIVVLEYPRADLSVMYDDMFAVPTATVDAARSMEVITLLNTDSEFRNLVQYGVLDENYSLSYVEIDGEEYPQIERLNNYYMMDINKTGNLFVAYPEEGMPADIWEYGKIQNRDSMYQILETFDLAALYSIDLELLDAVAELSKEWKEQIEACETVLDLELLIETAIKETEENEILKEALNATSTNKHSLSVIYNEWYSKTYASSED